MKNKLATVKKKITIIIPAFNEESGIGRVIENIRSFELNGPRFNIKILVVDNCSTDKTAEIAKAKGAVVIFEQNRGKGNAIKAGFRKIDDDCDYVVMLDADNTYKPGEIPRMLEPIESGFADVIVGSRLGGKMNINSMTFSHRLANWFFTFLVRQFYLANITDVCSGFFAWRADVVISLRDKLSSPGFAIETEMVAKTARMGYKIYSVPITYDIREGKSKMSPLKDAWHIIMTIIFNFRWKPIRSKSGKQSNQRFYALEN